MGGHLDDLEFTFDHPVVSISFGLSCVFLIGEYHIWFLFMKREDQEFLFLKKKKNSL